MIRKHKTIRNITLDIYGAIMINTPMGISGVAFVSDDRYECAYCNVQLEFLESVQAHANTHIVKVYG